jgi:hypothetical protein
MRTRNLSFREKIMILLVLILIWILTIRFYILPVLPELFVCETSPETDLQQNQGNESMMNSLIDEIAALEERLKGLIMETGTTLTVSELHKILSEMINNCNGEFLEIDINFIKEDSTFSLHFLWQGEYSEWIRSLHYLQESSIIFDHELILLRTLPANQETLLLWEFQSQAGKKLSMPHNDAMIYSAEEGRNPFEIK